MELLKSKQLKDQNYSVNLQVKTMEKQVEKYKS